ncbi:MAG TPA: NlpC/P60 family protein [Cyclobacteriaceae bacterium]|nr:NlpC/P60 family protein [Cyclobacteriaceae bacterium]
MIEPGFGVCRLSAVPVLSEPKISVAIAQLLFGDSYEVTDRSKDKHWLRIKITFDGTEGWIDMRHHHSIPQEYFQQITQADFKITTDVVSTILYKKSPLPILLGSIVPIASAELFKMDEQFAFNGEAKALSQKREGEFIKSMAHKYLNAPETAGGKSPFGICAQGLTQMVFKISGYALPWELSQQALAGKKVKDAASAKPGDLAFFKNKSGHTVHAGIVLAESKIIHAHGQVRVDLLNDEGILHADSKIYSHTLAHIRRLLS